MWWVWSCTLYDVLFKAVVALYHVNDVFTITVDVMGDRSGFTCRVECV